MYDEILEESDKTCDSMSCTSSESYNQKPWLWKICSICGSSAVHKKCFASPSKAAEFVCRSCSVILHKIDSKHRKQTPTQASEISSRSSTSNLFIEESSSSSTEATDDEAMDVTSTESSEVSTDLEDKATNMASSSTEAQAYETKGSSDDSKKSKFIPWFSDDEQASEEEEDGKENVDVNNLKQKLETATGTIDNKKNILTDKTFFV